MPCYLLTWHTYGSWMPDRKRGYVRRDRDGILPSDPGAAEDYRTRMASGAVEFNRPHQAAVLSVMRESAEPLAVRLHALAVDPPHIHILVGWNDSRPWSRMRSSIRHSITRELNAQFGKRDWLSRGGSRKRVKGRAHFEHLISSYLPGHHALFWKEGDA